MSCCSPTIAIGCLGPQGNPGPTGPAGPTGPTGPAGGGGISVSITGNTAGTAALIAAGTLILAGGPNITLSQNSNSISISGLSGGGLAASIGGNTAGTLAPITSGTLFLAGGNNITLSQNGNSVTVSGPTQQSAVQITGNTSGTTALISSGALVLAGGNNITLSQVGNSVTISANTAAAANLSISAGSTSGAFGGLTFSNLNGITWGLNNGTITGSVSQSNQTEGFYAIGNTVGQSSSSTFDARSLSISGAGAVSVGYSGNALVISAAAGAQSSQSEAVYVAGNTTGQSSQSTYTVGSLNISAAGLVSMGWSSNSLVISGPGTTPLALSAFAVSNTTQSTSGTLAGSALSLAGAGGVSIGISNGSVVISGATGGGGGGATLSLYALGNTTQNSSTTLNQSALSFNALGAMTWGYSNGSIQVSAPATSSLSGTGFISVSTNGSTIFVGGNALSAYAVSNTTQSSSGVINGTALSFAGAGGVSIGVSNGSVVISGGAGGGASTGGFYALGNTTQNSSTTLNLSALSFNGLGMITVGYSNGSIQLSATQTNQTLGLYAVGNTTQNSSTTRDARSISFDGLGAMTVGFSNGSVQLSAPATSSISGTGAVSISVNGSTISIGAPAYGTLSYWDNGILNASSSVSQLGAGSVLLQPLVLDANLSISALREFISGSFSATNSSYGNTISVQAGIYTLNGSTLSLLASGSASYGLTNTSNNSASLYSGVKGLTVPLATALTPGNYWIGLWSNTASSGFNYATFSNVVQAEGSLTYNGILGSSAAGTNQIMLGGGVWNTTSASLPSSIGLSQISGTVGNIAPFVNLYNVSA